MKPQTQSIPGPTWWEGNTKTCKLSSDLHGRTVDVHECVHVCTHVREHTHTYTHTLTEESGEAVPCISQTAADLRSVPTSPPTSWCMTPFFLMHDGKQAGQICLGHASIDKREFLVPASVEGWSMRHSPHDWDIHQQPSPLRNFCSKKGYIAQINFPNLVNKGPWSLSTNF